MKFTILVFALHLAFILGQNFGERCTTPSGRDGFYRLAEDCYSALEGCQVPSGLICCADSRKSYRKCREYGKYVFVQVYEMAPMRREATNYSECHIDFVSLVVGGRRASPMEFPHMVAIGFGPDLDSASWMCGGSLISERHVLTAAHCASSRNRGAARWARVGDINLKDETDEDGNRQDFEIIQRILHPRYKPPSRYHDIAIFVLSDEVKMDAFSRPACLNSIPEGHMEQIVYATGWGKLDYIANSGSDNLMKVALNPIDYDICNITFQADVGGLSLKYGVQLSQMCAGEIKGGKDTCQGDSGGPLQVVMENPFCMYSIVGITSFGKFCGFKNSPAIYTRVFYYVPWIESIVWP